MTKTDEKLETYVLGDEYQGNFSLALPWSSSRLQLMLPMTILSSTTSYEHTDCAINNESNTLEMQHENMSIDEDESTVKVSAKKPKNKREEKQDEHITEITTRVGRIIRPRNVYT